MELNGLQKIMSTKKGFCLRFLLVSILLLFGCSTRELPKTFTQSADRSKLESLYRSLKALDASTTVSLNIFKMRELVQSAATELSIARDKATSPNEKRLTELFAHSLEAYKDSLTVWEAKIENPVDGPAIACTYSVLTIAPKYGLDCLLWGGNNSIGVIPKQTIDYLWIEAAKRLNHATAEYLEEPQKDGNNQSSDFRDDMYRSLNETIDRRKKAMAAEEQRIARLKAQMAQQERETRNSTMVFLANDDDGHYHTLYCGKVQVPRRLTYIGEAEKKGYTPCPDCRPVSD